MTFHTDRSSNMMTFHTDKYSNETSQRKIGCILAQVVNAKENLKIWKSPILTLIQAVEAEMQFFYETLGFIKSQIPYFTTSRDDWGGGNPPPPILFELKLSQSLL